MNKKEDVLNFVAQVDTIRTLKDGTAKITLEVGLDSYSEIQRILQLTAEGHQLFRVVIVPEVK